jgi:iron complex outermembrane receptor protein
MAQTGTIKGQVKTSDGQPAPYVNVTLKGENKGTVTEPDGTYIIKNVKPGSYTVATSFVGLAPQERTVEVIAHEVTVQDFDLQEDAHQLSEVEVIGLQSLNEQSAMVGKINIKPMDLPQSVMVIDRSILDRQQALNVGDVLMNASGVYVMGTSGGTQQELAGRGFAFGSNNTFKNGIRFNNAVMPELSSAERVEILKGSSAVLFGQVGAGGVINIVTKKPKFQNGGMLSFRTGSYGFIKPSLDFYGPINGSEHVAFRINSSYENAQSFRDNVESERIYFNPSFLIKAGKKTDVLIEADYLKDNRTLDFGTAAIEYKIANLPRNTFLNTSWAYYKAEQKTATLTVKHRLNEKWQLNVVGSYQGYFQDQFGTTRPNASSNFVKADGTWYRALQRIGASQDYFIGQADLIANLKTGKVEHALLIGADIDKYSNTALAYNNIAYDTINVFNVNSNTQRHDMLEVTKNTNTKNPVNRVGIYVQDMLSIGEKFKALVGIRYSYVDTRSAVYNYKDQKTANANSYIDAFSPRLGLVYQPTKITSLFASYSNSFDLNTGTDNKGNALNPSIIDQYEVGIKNEFFRDIISVNVTAYRIVNSNFAQTILNTSTNYNPIYPAAKELVGEVTSKGIEVDVMSKSFHGVSIIAGYSYNDTRYTESNVYIKNSRLRYNPQHTATMSLSYKFNQIELLKGFDVGFISQYIGQRVAGRSTRTNVMNDTYKLMPIPDYFLFDLSMGYAWNNISVRAKISNLLNELSYNVHDDNSVNPIAPRQFSATVSYKF